VEPAKDRARPRNGTNRNLRDMFHLLNGRRIFVQRRSESETQSRRGAQRLTPDASRTVRALTEPDAVQELKRSARGWKGAKDAKGDDGRRDDGDGVKVRRRHGHVEADGVTDVRTDDVAAVAGALAGVGRSGRRGGAMIGGAVVVTAAGKRVGIWRRPAPCEGVPRGQ
jgi:hypothetical protein